MNANRKIRPANGLGPAIALGARQLAEKRARELTRERQHEEQRLRLTAYSHGIFEGRRREAMADEARAHNGIGVTVDQSQDVVQERTLSLL